MKNIEYIIWTKVYKVDHQSGQFKIIISSHSDGMFYGMVLYYLKSGSWQDDNLKVDLNHQNFLGTDEDEVYSSCISWIQQNLAGRFRVLAVDV